MMTIDKCCIGVEKPVRTTMQFTVFIQQLSDTHLWRKGTSNFAAGGKPDSFSDCNIDTTLKM